MTRTRLLLVFIVLSLFLPPRPAAAQDLGCELAKWLPGPMQGLFGAPWTDTVPVTIGTISLTVQICSPMAESATAAQMLQLAAQALPILDDLTDVQLRGSLVRPMVMLDSATIYGLGADGFIDAHDTIHLHPRSLPSTVVHEVAHYWASRDNFGDAWLVEAYAEYLTSMAMAQLGQAYDGHDAGTACTDFSLLNWSHGLPDREVCAYAVGRDVLHDLSVAAGEDTLRQVLGMLSSRPQGVTSWELLVALEAASGADLTAVMRGRVFTPEDDWALGERSRLRAQLAHASTLAAPLGLTPPTSIAALIDSWELPAADAALQALLPLLTTASAVDQRCRDLQLPCLQPWRELGEDPAHWRALTDELAGAARVLDTYARLREQSTALEVGIPAELASAAAALQVASLPALETAAQTLGDIQALEQQCAPVELDCRSFWASSWEAGDLNAVSQVTHEVRALVTTATGLEERCGAGAEGCRALWQERLAQAGIGAARETLTDVGQLLDRAEAAEQHCRAVAWPCPAAWRQPLAAGDLGAAEAQLQAQVQALPALIQAEERLDAVQDPALVVERVLPGSWRPATQMEAAREAFGRGELGAAQELAAEAFRQRRLIIRVAWWSVVGFSVALMLLGGVGFGRSLRKWKRSMRPLATSVGAWPQSGKPAPVSSHPGQTKWQQAVNSPPVSLQAASTDADLLHQLLDKPVDPTP